MKKKRKTAPKDSPEQLPSLPAFRRYVKTMEGLYATDPIFAEQILLLHYGWTKVIFRTDLVRRGARA
jgi:hypothetical protein